MKCVVCKHGETKPGLTTVTLERNGATIVIKSVPAAVCGNCGERYVDGAITDKLIARAEGAALAGVQVDIREYATV